MDRWALSRRWRCGFPEPKPFTTEDTEDHGEKPRLTNENPAFGEANNLGWFNSPLVLSDRYFWPVLQLDCVIGQIIGLVVYRGACYQTCVQNLSIDSDFSLMRY